MITIQQAPKIIAGAVKDGRVSITKHAKGQMAKRDIIMTDVLRVLQKGHIFQPPDRDVKTGAWVYRVEGHTVDSVSVKVAVEITDAGDINVVTVF